MLERRTTCGQLAIAIAIAAGADVKVVQQLLGHPSATMTMDTYGHLFETRLDEVGDALDRARQQAGIDDLWETTAEEDGWRPR